MTECQRQGVIDVEHHRLPHQVCIPSSVRSERATEGIAVSSHEDRRSKFCWSLDTSSAVSRVCVFTSVLSLFHGRNGIDSRRRFQEWYHHYCCCCWSLFFICIPLLFSGFKTGAERSNLDDVKVEGTLSLSSWADFRS